MVSRKTGFVIQWVGSLLPLA